MQDNTNDDGEEAASKAAQQVQKITAAIDSGNEARQHLLQAMKRDKARPDDLTPK
ncbi:MAG: hypothetical protein ABTQ34_07330 [Bdellovibrionales bacterium]